MRKFSWIFFTVAGLLSACSNDASNVSADDLLAAVKVAEIRTQSPDGQSGATFLRCAAFHKSHCARFYKQLSIALRHQGSGYSISVPTLASKDFNARHKKAYQAKQFFSLEGM